MKDLRKIMKRLGYVKVMDKMEKNKMEEVYEKI
jgi:hypothetical protein